MEYPITVFRLPRQDVLRHPPQPSFDKFWNEPLFSLGFNHYIHQRKDKLEVLKKPEYASRNLHHVVNPFEHRVPNHSTDIATTALQYFKTDHIISRAFYKIWEMLLMFDLADTPKALTSVHIAEAPGSFLQALSAYRDMFYAPTSSKDKHVTISVEPTRTKNEGYVPEYDVLISSDPKMTIAKHGNNDITDPRVLQQFTSGLASTADLVTADGGFNWANENYQEQEAYHLLFAEILAALKVQKKGGHFVLKVFEHFTPVTIKLMGMLTDCYQEVHIVKPMMSRLSNSERYLVCVNYQGIAAATLRALEEANNAIHANKDKYLHDIFPAFNINEPTKLLIRGIAVGLANAQHRMINDMLTYLKGGNYYGKRYHDLILAQKKANDFWISYFLPMNVKDLKKAKSMMRQRIAALVSA